MTDEGNRKREESRRVFSEAASTYDRIGPRSFSHFGQRLVDLAEIAPGAKVLDVAAGRGAVLFPAAVKVGSSGLVVGIDFTAAMVSETAKDIESRKIREAEIRQMDAEQMVFTDASFDCVTCGFALWMFAEPARVLQEFHRVLKRGGRVALSTWSADNPSQTWCHAVLRPYAPASASRSATSKNDSRFDTPSQLESAMQKAGFTDIRIAVEEQEFVYADEEEYWLTLWSAGLRRQLEKMAPEALERAKRDVFHELQELKQQDGFHIVSRALFAFGTKPAS